MFNKTLAIAATVTAITIGAMGATAPSANASAFNDNGMTTIWVTIHAYPGESRWEACRRVYQRDVYQVRRGHGDTMRCKIDHSRAFDRSERYQNFN